MSRRGNRTINLPAPYLKRVWLDQARVGAREAYPFCLPIFAADFELRFEASITIVVGENGTGKSTILEGIAALAGFDDAGGGNGYRPVDHSDALEKMGSRLSTALRASWLPKITNGWFFRAESFFSVARWLDQMALEDMRMGLRVVPLRIFCRIRTARVSCDFSKSAAGDKASLFSTSRNPRCRPRGRSNSSSCCDAWRTPESAKSSWQPMRRC